MVLFSVVLFCCSCALKPIPSDYSYIKEDFLKTEFDKLGNGNVLIYNEAGIFYKFDGTGEVNIWIDDKPLGQIRSNEYIIVDLKNGTHKFEVHHLDLFKMKSVHELEIDHKVKVIKVKPTFVSNKLQITNELPVKFDKFTYAKNRAK